MTMAGKDIISVTFFYKDGSIRVSMGALESFGLPKFIRFLINSSKKTFAVEPCNRSDLSGVHVTYTMSGLTAGFRTFSVLLVEQIYEFMNWDIKKRYRVYGNYIKAQNVAVFDLNHYGFVEDLKYYGKEKPYGKKKKKTNHKS